jgi:hypothetical protein
MCEHDVSKPAVRAFRRCESGRPVAQVSLSSRYAPLQHERVGTVAQHLSVVIRFENQDLDSLDRARDGIGHHAKVVDNGSADARRLAGGNDRDWLFSVVRCWNGSQLEVADLDRATRRNRPCVCLGQRSVRALRSLGGVNLPAPFLRARCRAFGVIDVLMRDDDSFNRARIDADGREPLRHHASGKPCVDQNARVPGLQEDSVSVASTSEHAKLHSADSLAR